MEENGKITILRGVLTAQSNADLQKTWVEYRKHTGKNYLTLLPSFVSQLGVCPKLEELRDLFSRKMDTDKARVDAIKQLGLYSDCLGKGDWSVPSETIDEQIASSLVKLASALTRRERPVTVQELELWQEHMRTGLTRTNLLNWADAMVTAGLSSPDYADQIRQFTEGLTGGSDVAEVPVV